MFFFSGFYSFRRQSVRSTCSKDLQSKCFLLRINPGLLPVYVAHTEYCGVQRVELGMSWSRSVQDGTNQRGLSAHFLKCFPTVFVILVRSIPTLVLSILFTSSPSHLSLAPCLPLPRCWDYMCEPVLLATLTFLHAHNNI